MQGVQSFVQSPSETKKTWLVEVQMREDKLLSMEIGSQAPKQIT